jgi:hypothetical protein
VHLSGRFGDIQMSVDGDQGFARQVNSPTKKKVRTSKGYKLPRKNNAEFAGAGLVADLVLGCIGGHWNYYAERYFRPRLHGLLRKLIQLGPGDMGQREFRTAQHLDAFRNLELDSKDKFDRRFRAPFTVTVNADRNTATLDVSPFHTQHHLDAPQGATHFRVFLGVGGLSDLVWVPRHKGYFPSQPDLDTSFADVHGPLITLDGALHPGFQLSIGLSGLPVLGSDACLLVSVGIDFVRVINGMEDELASGGAVKVVGAW